MNRDISSNSLRGKYHAPITCSCFLINWSLGFIVVEDDSPTNATDPNRRVESRAEFCALAFPEQSIATSTPTPSRKLAKSFCGILTAAVHHLVRSEILGHAQPILQHINRYDASSARFPNENTSCPHRTDAKDGQSCRSRHPQSLLRGVLCSDHVGHHRTCFEGECRPAT